MNTGGNPRAPRRLPQSRPANAPQRRMPYSAQTRVPQRTPVAARPIASKSANPKNARVQMHNTAPAKTHSSAGKGANRIGKSVLAVLTLVLGVFGFAAGLVKKLNRKLDIFRKSEIQKTVTNSILAAIALTVVLSVFAVCFPAIRMGWAKTLCAFGANDRAARIAHVAEKSGTNPDKIQSLRHRIAGGYIEDERYDDALSILLLTDQSDKNTVSLTEKARMSKGRSLYALGKYEEASRVFYLLSASDEGHSRYHDSLLAMAVEAYKSGDESLSHQIIMSVSGADQRIERVLMDVTNSKAETETLMMTEHFNPQALKALEENVQAVLSAKNSAPFSKIAAGNRHTVGLRSDGTVLGAGDNYYGQLNVSDWRDVVSVAAGAWHTVGLKTDGTVIAVGDNSQGQLEVTEWTDIVMIACADYDTVGLKSDGTVVFTGMHDYKEMSDWNNVTLITAGAYSVGALYNQGSMLSSNVSAQMKAGSLFADLSISGACAAGVLYDGTLVSSFENVPAWEGVTTVEVSSTAVFVITSEGELKSHFFRPEDDPGIFIGKKAVDIASSGTHHVVLFEDGTVQAFGLNDLGQLNVSGWQL